MHQSISRRLHPRRQLDRTLRVDRWDAAGIGAHEMLDVAAVDISSGGVGILTAQALHVGEVVKLEYDLNGGGITLPIYSEVVWCQAVDNGSRIGMRFLV
jgi:Tfp pilus assembly protein PilZ